MRIKVLTGGEFVAGEDPPEEPGERSADRARCACRRETIGLR
jgi:hypothetical protein